MTAPVFPVSYTGDGTTTVYDLGFKYLDASDVRVYVNGVLQTLGTHYAIQTPVSDSALATIRFITAPTNAYPIKFSRNTSLALRRPTLEIGHLVALQALYREQEQGERRITLRGLIDATALAAGTAKSFVAPCDGYIEVLRSVVTEAVGTGGDLTVEVETVAVVGLTNTIASSAAAGKTVEDTPTTAQSTTTQVRRGQTITVTPGAAFATSGAALVELEIQPADLG